MGFNQRVDYVLERLAAMKKAFNETDDGELKDELRKWINNIMGIVGGHDAEFKHYYQHGTVKGRKVYRGTYSDVTVGKSNDMFAKSIQSKSTMSDRYSVIDGLIKDAANQLTGERGERPRDTDRRIIDIQVINRLNSWPYTGLYERNNASSLEVLSDARKKVLAALKDYKQNEKGLSLEAIRKLYDIQSVPQKPKFLRHSPHAGGMARSTVMGFDNGAQFLRIVTLTVKLRFEPEVPIKGDTLAQLYFIIARDGDSLTVVEEEAY